MEICKEGKKLKILIACEFSGTVRDAFIKKGHEAISCDLLPTESHGPHYQGDVKDLLYYPWDMVVAFPPCTDLSVSGARHFKQKKFDGRQYASVSFFMMFTKLDHVEKVVIENPVSIMSSLYRKPDQIIHPWQFGHGETKTTCLWLKRLKKLVPSNVVDGRENRIHKMPPSENRWRERSRFYQGFADAFAEQWG